MFVNPARLYRDRPGCLELKRSGGPGFSPHPPEMAVLAFRPAAVSSASKLQVLQSDALISLSGSGGHRP